MKKTLSLIVLALAIAAIAVPVAGAKPLKPGPAQQARIDAANSSADEGGWTGAAVVGGLVAAALAGTGIVVVRNRRQDGIPAVSTRRPVLDRP